MLFADLVGSTGLAGSQDPERTRGLLERFYEAMAGEIEIAGGTIEKFAGDAVIAVFGAPAALEDHAERALHAALAMQRRLRELFGEQLALRIGVDTRRGRRRRAARRQLVRHRRPGERRCATGAGAPSRTRSSSASARSTLARRVRVRCGSDDRGKGKAGRHRVPPARAAHSR